MIPAESLTLSASLFHATIDAWLPANFGTTRTDASKAAEWDAALVGAQRDRLGLGHAALSDPGARARAQTQRAGMDLLARKLKRSGADQGQAQGQSQAQGQAQGQEDSDSDAGESRSARKVGGKKRKADPFRSKSAVHPLLNLKNPIPGYNPPGADGAGAGSEASTSASVSTGSTVSAGSSTSAGKKRARDDGEDGGDHDAGVSGAGASSGSGAGAGPSTGAAMTKSEQRREKRKRQKMRKRAAAEAAA